MCHLGNHTENVDMTSNKFSMCVTILICRPSVKSTTP